MCDDFVVFGCDDGVVFNVDVDVLVLFWYVRCGVYVDVGFDG